MTTDPMINERIGMYYDKNADEKLNIVLGTLDIFGSLFNFRRCLVDETERIGWRLSVMVGAQAVAEGHNCLVAQE
jgi:hypothetical protein